MICKNGHEIPRREDGTFGYCELCAEQDSRRPVDERRLYDPRPDPETKRRGGFGGW